MNTYFPKYSTWVFALLFCICAYYYGYHKVLFKGPQAIHQWRQCDCLSQTKNYYQNNNAFLEPSVHNLCNDGNGKTVSDFPLVYYGVAQLWKVFGANEAIYRGLILGLFFLALIAFLKITEQLLKDSLIAVFLALLLFTSPTLVYYGNNFLMNMPAFSLGIFGLYFFLKFAQSGSNRNLVVAAIFYALAGLLKSPALLGYMAILGLFVLERFGLKLLEERKVFPAPFKQALILSSVLIVQVVWYTYAHNYNSVNCAGVFLVGILPIWKMDQAQIIDTLEQIKLHLQWDYFSPITLLFLVAAYFFVLINWKRTDKVISTLMVVLSFGFVTFCLLFFEALRDHDYYTLNLFILPAITGLAVFSTLEKNWTGVFRSPVLRGLLLLFLAYNVVFAKRRVRYRYDMTAPHNALYVNHLESLTRISTYLQEIGIDSNDRFVLLSDKTINVGLYLMNMKGWTNYNIQNSPKRLEEVKEMGAKYLLVFDQENFPEMNAYFGNKIGQFETISIYEL